jgi:predicted nucleic acid-binding protein
VAAGSVVDLVLHAAICRTIDATLVTRNSEDFDGTGIELINPWELG